MPGTIHQSHGQEACAVGMIYDLRNDDFILTTPVSYTHLDVYKRQVKDDSLYLIPAFSGLGAPYWDSHASAAIVGMTRTTGTTNKFKKTEYGGINTLCFCPVLPCRNCGGKVHHTASGF